MLCSVSRWPWERLSTPVQATGGTCKHAMPSHRGKSKRTRLQEPPVACAYLGFNAGGTPRCELCRSIAKQQPAWHHGNVLQQRASGSVRRRPSTQQEGPSTHCPAINKLGRHIIYYHAMYTCQEHLVQVGACPCHLAVTEQGEQSRARHVSQGERRSPGPGHVQWLGPVPGGPS